MSMGKSGGEPTAMGALSPEQKEQIGSQSSYFNNTIAPAYQQATSNPINTYNQPAAPASMPTATPLQNQPQQSFGSVGSSADTNFSPSDDVCAACGAKHSQSATQPVAPMANPMTINPATGLPFTAPGLMPVAP